QHSLLPSQPIKTVHTLLRDCEPAYRPAKLSAVSRDTCRGGSAAPAAKSSPTSAGEGMPDESSSSAIEISESESIDAFHIVMAELRGSVCVGRNQKRAEKPPSLWRSWPLIHRPSSDRRNDVTAAMSRGVPSRRKGCCGASPLLVASSIHPVSIGPGLTAFAEMLLSPSSRAAEMTMRSSAPFEAPYGRFPVVWSLVNATIAPPEASTCRANAAMRSSEARALTAR